MENALLPSILGLSISLRDGFQSLLQTSDRGVTQLKPRPLEKNLRIVSSYTMDEISRPQWAPYHPLKMCVKTFTDAYLPLLTTLVLAKQSRCLRRTRFDSFIRRDMALDQVINEIVGGSLSRNACESAWVAFGESLLNGLWSGVSSTSTTSTSLGESSQSESYHDR